MLDVRHSKSGLHWRATQVHFCHTQSPLLALQSHLCPWKFSHTINPPVTRSTLLIISVVIVYSKTLRNSILIYSLHVAIPYHRTLIYYFTHSITNTIWLSNPFIFYFIAFSYFKHCIRLFICMLYVSDAQSLVLSPYYSFISIVIVIVIVIGRKAVGLQFYVRFFLPSCSFLPHLVHAYTSHPEEDN